MSISERQDVTPDLTFISVSIVTAQIDTKTTGITENVFVFCETNFDKNRNLRNVTGH